MPKSFSFLKVFFWSDFSVLVLRVFQSIFALQVLSWFYCCKVAKWQLAFPPPVKHQSIALQFLWLPKLLDVKEKPPLTPQHGFFFLLCSLEVSVSHGKPKRLLTVERWQFRKIGHLRKNCLPCARMLHFSLSLALPLSSEIKTKHKLFCLIGKWKKEKLSKAIDVSSQMFVCSHTFSWLGNCPAMSFY